MIAFVVWKLALRVRRWNSTSAHKSTASISYSEVTSPALRLEPQEEIKPMKKIKIGE